MAPRFDLLHECRAATGRTRAAIGCRRFRQHQTGGRRGLEGFNAGVTLPAARPDIVVGRPIAAPHRRPDRALGEGRWCGTPDSCVRLRGQGSRRTVADPARNLLLRLLQSQAHHRCRVRQPSPRHARHTHADQARPSLRTAASDSKAAAPPSQTHHSTTRSPDTTRFDKRASSVAECSVSPPVLTFPPSRGLRQAQQIECLQASSQPAWLEISRLADRRYW